MRDLRGLFLGSFATALAACSSGPSSGPAIKADTAVADDAPAAVGTDAVPESTTADAPGPSDTGARDGASSEKAGADLGGPFPGRADASPVADLGKADVASTETAALRDTLASRDTVVPRTDTLPSTGHSPAEACASEPLRTTGVIHYVCDCQDGASSKCVPGNDNNAGTSPGAPLRSFAKAASTFAKMPAGDTVALCRGGRWNAGGGGFANAGCTKDNTCDLRDYAPPWGDGSEPLPSIWVSGGSTLMTFTHISQHQEGFRVLNLDLHGTSADTAIFFWNETTDVDLCNLSMDGFNISVNMSGGDKPEFGTPANIILRGSRITNNSNIGYIAVCDNCAIEDSYFDNNGARNATTHSVYFASQVWTVNGANVVHETTGMRLSRNEIHHSTIQCKGSPVVVHGRHKDVVLENNLVDAASSTDACWGPGVGCGGYPYGCWFRNSIIRGNTMRGLGNAGTENDNCTGCTVVNNLIILDNSGNGISIGGQKPRPVGDPGYTRSDGQLDDASNNNVVRNNTIYFTDTATSGKGISLSGTGHTVENNAIAFAVTKPGPSDNFCYGLPANPATSMAGVDYNVCKIPSGAHWTIAAGAGAMSLDVWQAQGGMDKHSRAVDPMFTKAPADLSPLAGSPLINAGDATDSPSVDLNGKARDAQPDIGAFER